MKKVKLIAALFVFLGASVFAQKSDFRGASWGDSPTAVKANENSDFLSEDNNRIIYNGELANIKGNIIYAFTSSNKLMGGKYYLTPEDFDASSFVRDYKMFKELLTYKYGQTAKETITTTKKDTNISEEEWILYLEAGELTLENTWTTSKTNISLSLSKTGENIVLLINYNSKEFSELDTKEKREDILQNL